MSWLIRKKYIFERDTERSKWMQGKRATSDNKSWAQANSQCWIKETIRGKELGQDHWNLANKKSSTLGSKS